MIKPSLLLSLLFLLYASFAAPPAPSILKGIVYKSVMDFASPNCELFSTNFAANATLYLPGESKPAVYSGRKEILQYCQAFKKTILGMGAYPHDFFFASSGDRVVFELHIRAVSSDNCFIDWPSILHLEFDDNGFISKWSHFYDGDWINAAFQCKQQAAPPTDLFLKHRLAGVKSTVNLNKASSIKSDTYAATLAATSDCQAFSQLFDTNGNFSSPAGSKVSTGQTAIYQRCQEIKSQFAGAGNYPHDMYIGDNHVVFNWHIRAVTVENCFVSWSGILHIEFNDNGKIKNWEHYFDDEWILYAIKCRQ